MPYHSQPCSIWFQNSSWRSPSYLCIDFLCSQAFLLVFDCLRLLIQLFGSFHFILFLDSYSLFVVLRFHCSNSWLTYFILLFSIHASSSSCDICVCNLIAVASGIFVAALPGPNCFWGAHSQIAIADWFSPCWEEILDFTSKSHWYAPSSGPIAAWAPADDAAAAPGVAAIQTVAFSIWSFRFHVFIIFELVWSALTCSSRGPCSISPVASGVLVVGSI